MNLRWPLALLGAVLLVSALVFGLNRREQGRQIDRLEKVNIALCAQRHDLDSRIKGEARRLERSRQFLRDNPHGTPGIPEALIRAAINDDADTLASSRKTRRNLSILDCQERK